MRMDKTDKPNFPSHSELYRDFHFVKNNIFKEISEILSNEGHKSFDELGEVIFEENNWDIIISERWRNLKVYVEYKSSINEWHKQFDDFLRQIKKRRAGLEEVVVLLSFDPSFKEYKEACLANHIYVVVLSKELLELMRKEREKARNGGENND